VFDELKRATGARVVGKRVQKGLIAAVKRLTVADCEAIKVLTSDTDALLRTVPAALHRAILQQYLYAVIARRGRWNPQGRPDEPRPWEYPGAARRRAFA
jgi:DNA polymerase-3 subunit delta